MRIMLLRLKLWLKKLSPRALILISVAALSGIGAWMMIADSDRIVDIGTNLLADGFVMLLTVFLIDRLIRAQAHRDLSPRIQLIYYSARSIYTRSLAIWGTLVFLAVRLDDYLEQGEDQLQEAFEERIGKNAFSPQVVEAIKAVGGVLASHELRDPIQRDVEIKARRIIDDIEKLQLMHGPHLPALLYFSLDKLRTSALLRFCSEVSTFSPFDLHTLGGNIVFSDKQHEELVQGIFGRHHSRDDPRPMHVLSNQESFDLPEVFQCLADQIDALADDIGTRQAHYVVRSLSPMDLPIQWHAYELSKALSDKT